MVSNLSLVMCVLYPICCYYVCTVQHNSNIILFYIVQGLLLIGITTIDKFLNRKDKKQDHS